LKPKLKGFSPSREVGVVIAIQTKRAIIPDIIAIARKSPFFLTHDGRREALFFVFGMLVNSMRRTIRSEKKRDVRAAYGLTS